MPDITSNLLLHLPCDDNAGNTTVAARVGTNATLQGGDNTSAKSVTGPSVGVPFGFHLNGTDDHIQLPDLSSSLGDNATLAMWLKLDNATPATASLSGIGNLGAVIAASADHMPYTDGLAYLKFFRCTSNTIANRINSINLSSGPTRTDWHHIAVTQTPGANGWKLYANGALVTQTTGLSSLYYDSDLWSIGRSFDGTSSYWLDGSVADFRIYNRSLLIEDVNAIFSWTGFLPWYDRRKS